jgi:glyoxylase-like metal-dependent hydrolase (beta-lactamase superfamily II)
MLTAPNGGPKTLDGTNAYLVSDQGRSLLIDPGPDMPAYLHELATFLRPAAVEAILLTHSHPDHADGAADLACDLGVPIFVSSDAPKAVQGRLGNPHFFEPGASFTIGALQLEVIPSPGHADDHVCFLLLPDRILFSGDTILGEGTTLIALPEGDMIAYMATLDDLGSRHAAIIAPGHGPLVTDPLSKIQEYISHRRQREAEILTRLAASPASISEVADSVYGPLDDAHSQLARLSVDAQLDKLRRENRVKESEGVYSLDALT